MVCGRFRLFCNGGNAPAISEPDGMVFRAGTMLIDFRTSSSYLFFVRDLMRRNWLWLIPIAVRISSSYSPSR